MDELVQQHQKKKFMQVKNTKWWMDCFSTTLITWQPHRVWGSDSHSRTLSHVDLRGPGSNQQPSDHWSDQSTPEAPEQSHNWHSTWTGTLLYCACICFLQASSAAPGEHIFCTYLTQSKCTISLYSLASMQKWALLERHLFWQMELLELNIRSKKCPFLLTCKTIKMTL